MRIYLAAFFLVLGASFALAQTGTIRGTVLEDISGEPLIGVTVVIEGTTTGAVTDFDGNFFIKTSPGKYNVQVSYISFETVTISEVEVKADEATFIGTIKLVEEASELEEIVVTAKAIRTTEAALLTVKKKSANVIDGISSETFKKLGDSDAAGAIKRVTGVSVQDDSYVYVRGLGDRYTKTVLNAVEIPGLDPDRNALQIDIFPTNVINNIVVYKAFTPDLSADFVGGTVNIETKDFPEEKTFSAGISLGYNPQMHFRSDFLSYEGGGTDFLGFDDGTRDLPFDAQNQGDLPLINNNSSTSQVDQVIGATRDFSSALGAVQNSSLANLGLSFSGGNQIEKEKVTIGYNYALGYDFTQDYFAESVDAIYQKSNNPDELTLQDQLTFSGPYAQTQAQLSGLFGGAIKTKNSKYSLKVLHIQNGTEVATKRLRVRNQENINNSVVDNLEYTERFLTNVIGSGTHYFNNAKSELSWDLSTTKAVVNDRDVRITPFLIDDEDGSLSINATESGEPNRIWRLLDERNFVAKVDYKMNFDFRGRASNLKFGLSDIFKSRDYIIHDFFVDTRGVTDFQGDPNQLLSAENILDGQTLEGTYVQSRFTPNNTYAGTMNIAAAYAMGEFALTDKLRTIVGLRVENYVQTYTGRNTEALAGIPGVGRSFDNDEVLNSIELFPSFHMRYSPNEKSNFRGVYARTIARPSFKEKSTAEIQDVKTGQTFIGDIDLIETNIDNFDLRYEYFMRGGQTYSVSAFYKIFNNPIELVRRQEDASNFGPKNVGRGTILGAEFEVRKNLDFMSYRLDKFQFGANVTVTASEVDREEEEIEGVRNGLRDGEELETTRDFVGQSPLILNFSLDYNDFEKGWQGSLAFNRQQAALYNVGVNFSPDIYTVPFNSLNLKVIRTFGKEQENALSFKVDNILNDERQREWRSFGSESFLQTSRDPGRTFSVSFTKSF